MGRRAQGRRPKPWSGSRTDHVSPECVKRVGGAGCSTLLAPERLNARHMCFARVHGTHPEEVQQLGQVARLQQLARHPVPLEHGHLGQGLEGGQGTHASAHEPGGASSRAPRFRSCQRGLPRHGASCHVQSELRLNVECTTRCGTNGKHSYAETSSPDHPKHQFPTT